MRAAPSCPKKKVWRMVPRATRPKASQWRFRSTATVLVMLLAVTCYFGVSHSTSTRRQLNGSDNQPHESSSSRQSHKASSRSSPSAADLLGGGAVVSNGTFSATIYQHQGNPTLPVWQGRKRKPSGGQVSQQEQTTQQKGKVPSRKTQQKKQAPVPIPNKNTPKQSWSEQQRMLSQQKAEKKQKEDAALLNKFLKELPPVKTIEDLRNVNEALKAHRQRLEKLQYKKAQAIREGWNQNPQMNAATSRSQLFTFTEKDQREIDELVIKRQAVKQLRSDFLKTIIHDMRLRETFNTREKCKSKIEYFIASLKFAKTEDAKNDIYLEQEALQQLWGQLKA